MSRIRSATLADAARIREIYAPYILNTPITFEIEVPPVEEFSRRIAEHMGKFPWLVFEAEGVVSGYAYAAPFKSRPAYEWSVETSVYIAQDSRRSGIGKTLYAKILEIVKEQGAVNVIGGLTIPNEASVRLHEHFGFKHVARYKDAGFKMGKWWDVGYWQLQFPKPEVPRPLRAFREIEARMLGRS